MSAPTVEVLRCASCDAPVPLGDGDEAACRHCGARVPVPETHRALRDELARDAAGIARAEKLYASLAKPPPRWLRALGSTRLFAALTLVLFAAAFVVLVRVVPLIDARLSQLLGARLRDTWDAFDVTLFHTALLSLAAAPWLLLTIGERRAAARMHLRAELAAAPPAFAGGERCCRNCGAPLCVRDGARGARCAYCRADNFVVGNDELQRRVAHRGRHVAGAVADAQTLDGWERVWLRRSLIVRLGVPLVFFFIASGCELLTWRTPKDQRFSELVGRAYEVRRAAYPVKCDQAGCFADRGYIYQYALRRGEKLRVRVVSMPPGDELVSVVVRQKTVDSSFSPDWPILAASELRDGEELVARAPFTGWYDWGFEYRRKQGSALPDCVIEHAVER